MNPLQLLQYLFCTKINSSRIDPDLATLFDNSATAAAADNSWQSKHWCTKKFDCNFVKISEKEKQKKKLNVTKGKIHEYKTLEEKQTVGETSNP